MPVVSLGDVQCRSARPKAVYGEQFSGARTRNCQRFCFRSSLQRVNHIWRLKKTRTGSDGSDGKKNTCCGAGLQAGARYIVASLPLHWNWNWAKITGKGEEKSKNSGEWFSISDYVDKLFGLDGNNGIAEKKCMFCKSALKI